MRQHEQKMAAIEWLSKKANECKTSSCRRFTPKQVAEGIGGAYTAIGGKVAKEIVEEITQRGIPAEYLSDAKKRFFVLSRC